ncbi:MAG TPA: hypothetical protein VFH31_19565 [Pyrinomonadaceae bacterium]|nr:hypothetical protein [Pyrinomonadaceae bacterium]
MTLTEPRAIATALSGRNSQDSDLPAREVRYADSSVALAFPPWARADRRGRDGCLGRVEAGARMRTITQWLPLRATTPAERKGTAIRHLIFVPVPVDQPYLVTIDQIRTVLTHLDRDHRVSYICSKTKSYLSRARTPRLE